MGVLRGRSGPAPDGGARLQIGAEPDGFFAVAGAFPVFFEHEELMKRFRTRSKGESLSVTRPGAAVRRAALLRRACAVEALEERRLFAVNLISTAMGGGAATGGAGFEAQTGVETPSVSD